jgi:histidyl-tRNA synthetase
VLELLKEQNLVADPINLDAYAIVPEAQALPVALRTLQTLRELGVSIQMHTSTGEGMGSIKSQFKRADSSGARFALIFGAEELSNNQLAVKSLRDGDGQQITQSLANIAAWAVTLQSKN